ncbi:MAG TPA: 8-oxoguanine deaminase [Anaerolineae bacterium]|nr:8-oxoguanine deaminase [Anaerolineae bacterium]
MPSLLLKNATLLATMDDDRRRFQNGGIYVEDNVISQVGPSSNLPPLADRVVDARGMVVLPGLINTHHHLYQSLTRALPGAQNAKLFDWLRYLYPIWAGLTAEAVYVSALVGLGELALSGCTTSTDHLYIYPNDARIDDEIRAARDLGIRFQPSRGSMSMGESEGGLPPDSVVEDEDAIMADTERACHQHHDPSRYSMVRIAVGPCSPFSVTPELMRRSATLARDHGLHLHTHVAETADENEYCRKMFGVRPVELMRQLEWVGPDVSWAHCVHLNEAEIDLMAETGTGVSHCPTSNMRLGSGIAPVRAMLDAGVKVAIAVDGSASNDSGHLIDEVRHAMLLQRVALGADALSSDEALWMGTRGGAAVLGRDDVGALAPGMAADFIGIRLDRLALAGAQADPLAALIFCAPPTVDLSVINGRVVVENGQIQTIDMPAVITQHNEIASRLLNRAQET